MPARVHKFLDQMDYLREQSNNNVDSVLQSINIDELIRNPEKGLKFIVLKAMQKNAQLMLNARKEGFKFAKSLE